MNLEAFQDVPDAVEQVDKRIVAVSNVLGRLKQGVDFSVIRPELRRWGAMQTIRRKLTPPRIADTGGNACESGQSGGAHLKQAISNKRTHRANTVHKCFRKRIHDVHGRFENFIQCFTFSRFTKGLGQLSNDDKDVTSRLAVFEFGRKRMFSKVIPCVFSIFV
jgi:hypothetical protein